MTPRERRPPPLHDARGIARLDTERQSGEGHASPNLDPPPPMASQTVFMPRPPSAHLKATKAQQHSRSTADLCRPHEDSGPCNRTKQACYHPTSFPPVTRELKLGPGPPPRSPSALRTPLPTPSCLQSTPPRPRVSERRSPGPPATCSHPALGYPAEATSSRHLLGTGGPCPRL